VNSLACAIANMEGANPVLAANNNPGNLRSGPGQIGTANGFAVFPDLETGWNALFSRIQSGIDSGESLATFFSGTPCSNPPANTCGGYAPSADANNPSAYTAYVASQAGGISSTTPLAQIQAAYDGSTSAAAGSGGGTASDAITADVDASTTDLSGWLASLGLDISGSDDSGGLSVNAATVGIGMAVLGALFWFSSA
jgi:hypothetical protein